MTAWEGPFAHHWLAYYYLLWSQVTEQDGSHFPGQDPSPQARSGRELEDGEAPPQTGVNGHNLDTA